MSVIGKMDVLRTHASELERSFNPSALDSLNLGSLLDSNPAISYPLYMAYRGEDFFIFLTSSHISCRIALA